MRWCDLTCPEASFPREDAVDGAGSCRTFAALHCAVLNRLVPKNAPCAAEPILKKRRQRASNKPAGSAR